MSVFVNTFFEKRLQDLFNLAARLEEALGAAGIEYRVVGGLAAYLYVEEAEPDAGRLTKDIDIVVRRADLARIAEAVEPVGLEYRHAAGVDMLVQKGQPSARRAVHLLFEPALAGIRKIDGISMAPLGDLAAMMLTSFRLEDQMHLKDLDEQGLISSEIEAGLSQEQLKRLRHVRASD